MLRPQQHGFLLGAFDFDAVSFNIRIVLKGLMDYSAIKGAERFQFHDVAPTANFLGGFFGLFDERFPGLGAVAADVHHDFGRRGILLKEQPVGDVLEVCESLSLAANEAAGIIGFHIEQDAFLHSVFLDGGREAEEAEKLFQRGFGISGHNFLYFLFFCGAVNSGALIGVAGPVVVGEVLVSLVCRTVNKFWTVQ
jgi:hypothetical protein